MRSLSFGDLEAGLLILLSIHIKKKESYPVRHINILKLTYEVMESNIPLIEKYKPVQLSDLVGNPLILDRLQQMVLLMSIPNMVLSGPSGVGKTSSIYCLIRSLIPAEYLSSAILELNASEDRGINVVRNKIKLFAQKKLVIPNNIPKIIILDESDNMTIGSQQALRRIIEKCNNSTRFVFICNNGDQLIEAIQSRCVLLKYTVLRKEDILHKLQEICHKEEIDYTEEGIKSIFDVTKGDLRMAINSLESVYLCSKRICPENVYRICDVPSPDILRKVLQNCLEQNCRSAYQTVLSLWKKGYSSMDMLDTFYFLVRHDTQLSQQFSEHQKIILARIITKYYIRISTQLNTVLQLGGLISEFSRCFAQSNLTT